MKRIQEWLGHSTFSITADIYAHLDYKSKQGSAGVIAELLETKSKSFYFDFKQSVLFQPDSTVVWSSRPLERIQERTDICGPVFADAFAFQAVKAQNKKVADSFESATSGGDGGIRTHVPD